MKRILVLLFPFSLLVSCGPDIPEVACEFDAYDDCRGMSFSLVNEDTYENLLTTGEIDMDSIVITSLRGDTMYYEYNFFSDGWIEISRFSVYQELYCFNQCELDSAFTRTYYFYLGNGDTDTLDVHFPAHKNEKEVTFNWLDTSLPPDVHDSVGAGYSTHWLLKSFK